MNKSHLTAISRKSISAPIRKLNGLGLLKGRILDYGCGKGFDADELGFDKYDPYFFKELDRTNKYDTIVCNYVLNVISEKQEVEVIKEVGKLLNVGGKAYFTVRRDGVKEGFTSKGTFQRASKPKLAVLYSKKGSFEIYEMELI